MGLPLNQFGKKANRYARKGFTGLPKWLDVLVGEEDGLSLSRSAKHRVASKLSPESRKHALCRTQGYADCANEFGQVDDVELIRLTKLRDDASWDSKEKEGLTIRIASGRGRPGISSK